jgi:divalent metal cation (Fe/Co/Zn/Cd) transporter
MSVPLVALLVVMPLALAVAVGVVVITLAHRLSRRERAVTPSTALVAARRHAGSIDALAWVGLVAALVILQVFTPSLTNGLGTGVLIGLTPTLAGATFLAVQSVGELTWPRPSGPVRRAPLTPRTVRTLAPVGLRRLTWVWAGGLATTTAVATRSGPP